MPLPQHPRNLLIAIREQQGWTQLEIAERLGTTQANISKWENDPTTLSVDQIARLARTYGCAVETLVSGLTQPQEQFGGIDCGEPYKELDRQLKLLDEYLKSQNSNDDRQHDPFDRLEFAKTVRRFRRKPAVAAIGSVDAGKSTILNTLIGRSDLPEDYTATTKRITRVYHKQEKPGWLHDSENVIILRKQVSVDQLLDKEEADAHIVTIGTYALLEPFGTHDGKYADDSEADSIIVYADAPLLRSCYLIDFPGYGHNQTDNDNVRLVLQEATVVLYLSTANGFMLEPDVAQLAPIIECLPLLEKYDPGFPTLGHLMIVASQAFRRIIDEKLAKIMSKAAHRIERALGETRLKRRSSWIGRKIGENTISRQIFAFERDDPRRRDELFSFFQTLCSTHLPKAWSRLASEQVTTFKAAATMQCKETVRRWEMTLKEIEVASKQLAEMKQGEPKRKQKLDKQTKHLEESIRVFKDLADRNVKNIMAKWLDQDKVKGQIEARYKDKDDAQKSALVYILEQIQDEIEIECRKDALSLKTDLDALLDEYSLTVSKISNIPTGELLLPDFDAKAAFIAGVAGIGSIGILSSVVASWGVPLIGMSFLAGLGGAGSFLAMLGGPVGIAVGLLVAGIAWAIYSKSWEEALAKKLVQSLRERDVEGHFRTGVARLWSETEATYAEGIAKLEDKYQKHMANLHEIVHNHQGGKEKIEAELSAVKGSQSFFEGLPWKEASPGR